jgi:hypothetical protein
MSKINKNIRDDDSTIEAVRLWQLIGRELKEQNPRYIEILEEALLKDGTLAMKVYLGHIVGLEFKPDKDDLDAL